MKSITSLWLSGLTDLSVPGGHTVRSTRRVLVERKPGGASFFFRLPTCCRPHLSASQAASFEPWTSDVWTWPDRRLWRWIPGCKAMGSRMNPTWRSSSTTMPPLCKKGVAL